MADESPEDELARLRAENEALKKKVDAKPKDMYFKVSQKGAVSVYGLGRFPVTLYKEQWDRLLARADDIRDFIKENEGQLKTKE